ncbi:hypothetical protein BpHYR1_002455 [Brachionus plicatilis]|uniref:Uncharacterized protein n=1 Tax=Brachionus plicatilis TaxID=10195 RepID=A0A3M7SAW7_BRAPC|nr:hypothetical protein BpHYR1_002455 [Brachionus plicatilis]
MAQHDIMISSIKNVKNNADYLWLIIRPFEREFQARVNRNHVCLPEIRQLGNQSINSSKLNGLNQRSREPTVKINPLPTSAHRTIINEPQSKEDEWEQKRWQLMDEKENIEKQ